MFGELMGAFASPKALLNSVWTKALKAEARSPELFTGGFGKLYLQIWPKCDST
jgi:hypothetical protein